MVFNSLSHTRTNPHTGDLNDSELKVCVISHFISLISINVNFSACACVCVCVCQQGVHLAALLHHYCHFDRQLNALPYKVKVCEEGWTGGGAGRACNPDKTVRCRATGPAWNSCWAALLSLALSLSLSHSLTLKHSFILIFPSTPDSTTRCSTCVVKTSSVFALFDLHNFCLNYFPMTSTAEENPRLICRESQELMFIAAEMP